MLTLTTILTNLVVIFIVANLVQKPTVDQIISEDKVAHTTSSPQVAGKQTEESGILVIKVIDGDTIQLEDGQKVRYIGIDSPELKKDCFANEATFKNKELVEGKKIELVKDVSEKDRYGRLLRYVYVNGEFVNEILVREGYAKSAKYPPDIKFQKQLKEIENVAKEQQKGLWAACKD